MTLHREEISVQDEGDGREGVGFVLVSDQSGETEDPGDASARALWLVVLLASGGATLLPGERLELNSLPNDSETVDVAIATRFEDGGFTELVPRELVFEVRCRARNADDAVAQAGAVGGGLVALLSFVVNAHVSVPLPHLAFEAEPGLTRRQFWQAEVPFEQGLPRPNRILDKELLFPLLQAFLSSTEAARLRRAVGQYHAALRDWTVSGRPLALAHLYMALEALGPATERAERLRLGLSNEREHAMHRGVDLTLKNWKDVLLGRVRRDVLCKADRVTYDAARKASDGFEHGSMDFPQIKVAADQTGDALMGYVRRGVLDLLDLPEPVRQKLADKRPLDVSRLHWAIRGELTGDVSDPNRLGQDGAPYPYADWRITLDDLSRMPDGQIQMTPRMNLTARLAKNVQLTYTAYTIGVGVSDPDLFDYEPPIQEPTVVRRDDSPGE